MGRARGPERCGRQRPRGRRRGQLPQAPALRIPPGPRSQGPEHSSPKGKVYRPGPRVCPKVGHLRPPPKLIPNAAAIGILREPARTHPRPGLPLLAPSPRLPNNLEDPATFPASPGPSLPPSGLPPTPTSVPTAQRHRSSGTLARLTVRWPRGSQADTKPTHPGGRRDRRAPAAAVPS